MAKCDATFPLVFVLIVSGVSCHSTIALVPGAVATLVVAVAAIVVVLICSLLLKLVMLSLLRLVFSNCCC